MHCNESYLCKSSALLLSSDPSSAKQVSWKPYNEGWSHRCDEKLQALKQKTPGFHSRGVIAPRSTDFLHGLVSSWINNSSLHLTAERSLFTFRLILHSLLSFDSSVINYVGQFQSMTMILIKNGGWMSNEVNSHSSWDNINHNSFTNSTLPGQLNMFHSSFSRQHRHRGFLDRFKAQQKIE